MAALVDLVGLVVPAVREAQADLVEDQHMHQVDSLVDRVAQEDLVDQEAPADREDLAAHLCLAMKMFQQVSYPQAFLVVQEAQADLAVPVDREDLADLRLKANHLFTDQLAHQVALEGLVDQEDQAVREDPADLAVLVSFVTTFYY
jgi:hypothetical protein